MASTQYVWQVMKFLSKHPRLKIALFSIGGAVFFQRVVYFLIARWILRKKVKSHYMNALAKKRMARNFSQEAKELDLSNQTAECLVKAIISGNITAEEVLNSFTKKALELDDEIHAVTEPVMEAWDQVKMFDSLDEKNGLLHGIPISVKENFAIGGYPCTAGMANHLKRIPLEDCVVIKVLKNQGAIPFVRTNLPQTMMSYCSKNPIYGETLNPHNKSRTPGGSSSGEGALIGGGGSIIGIGSDVGGSIRVPASFCGVYSLKVTTGRFSSKGLFKTAPGRLCIKGSTGLIARDIDSLLLLSKATMSKDMWLLDPTVPQLPFNQQEFNQTKSLRIGYYTYDGSNYCQPPVIRAVMEAKEALERKGHTLVPIDFLRTFRRGFDNAEFYLRLMGADRGETLQKMLKNDQVEKGVRNYFRTFSLPRWLLSILSIAISQIDPFMGRSLRGFYGFNSVYEYYSLVADVADWKEKFMETWMENQYDAVICPIFPSPAPKKELIHSLTLAGTYCQLYNVLDYTAGCVPITKVTSDDVAKTLDPTFYNPQSLMEKQLLKSADGMEGLPVGIQCVTLPFREELCLRVMKDLDIAWAKRFPKVTRSGPVNCMQITAPVTSQS